MVAGFHLMVIAVATLFGSFMVGLAYAQWATRGMEVHRATK